MTDLALTSELLDLMEHEKVIDQGLQSIADVGFALEAIRDGRKYRAAGYSSFDAYCRERWGMSRSYADRSIQAAAVIAALTPMGGILPENERQVRPLAAITDPVERAEVWEQAVDEAGGEQPTAAEVADVIERRKPLVVPIGGKQHDGPPHPATYPRAVLDIFDEYLLTGETVLDPFAGIGTIHEFRPRCQTYGIELEEEWASVSEHTVHGDARDVAVIFGGATFDAIATSPAYGNRLADAFYNAHDREGRRTYAFDLGRPLSDGNGAGLAFGDEYRELHRDVWAAVVEVLKPGGMFLLNCKDFTRDGKIVPVTGWHVGELVRLGLRVIDIRTLPAAGLPYTTAKPLSELVVVLVAS